ncbi:hypothetical protein [Streptomyces sp. NPDC050504]|uniref:hypothetical protein n=1 Tax=Streptomyces sp. NPDC050504 TaxID=3365618 RepID=UPI00379ECC87
MTDPTPTVRYALQSRPAPSQPWQATGPQTSWARRDTALRALAARRQAQPSWEHRLVRRTTTVTETPLTEDDVPTHDLL